MSFEGGGGGDELARAGGGPGTVAPSPQRGAGTIALLQGEEGERTLDAFERLLWWLFAGSAGAKTRTLVLRAIREQPRNAQQLSELLKVDYTTVRHHLKVLERNRIVLTEGERYGKVYFLSDAMESHWPELERILEKAGFSSGGRGS